MKLIYVIAFLFGAARIAGVIWPMESQIQNLFKSSAHLFVGGMFGAWAAIRYFCRTLDDEPYRVRMQLWYTAWALSLLELAAFIWSKAR